MIWHKFSSTKYYLVFDQSKIDCNDSQYFCKNNNSSSTSPKYTLHWNKEEYFWKHKIVFNSIKQAKKFYDDFAHNNLIYSQYLLFAEEIETGKRHLLLDHY